MDIQNALIAAVKCLIRVFFRIETGLDQILGLCYRIRIGLHYTMKMLDWLRIANIQHYNIIAVRSPVRLGSLYKFNVIFGVISSEPAFRQITVTGIWILKKI